jgi:hypothetical protein
MKRKVGGLNILRTYELVEINPKDAFPLGIADGDEYLILEGVVCMSFHFAQSPTNVLANPSLDPVVKTP